MPNLCVDIYLYLLIKFIYHPSSEDIMICMGGIFQPAKGQLFFEMCSVQLHMSNTQLLLLFLSEGTDSCF